MWWQPHDWPPQFHSCDIIPPPVWSFAILRSKLYCGWWRRSFCPSICFDGDGWSVAGSGDDEDDNGKKRGQKIGWQKWMKHKNEDILQNGNKKIHDFQQRRRQQSRVKITVHLWPCGPTFEPISISGTYEGFNGNFKPCVFERVPLRNWSGGILKAQLCKISLQTLERFLSRRKRLF